jgi:hypothetical protein
VVEKVRSNAPYGRYVRQTWQHYVSNGSWRLRLDCARTVADLNAKELARDRRDTLWRRIGLGITLALMLLAMIAATAFEVSHARSRGLVPSA